MEQQFAYKIITIKEWKSLFENKCFNGNENDNLIQTKQMRNKYYKNKPIILLKLNFQNIQNVKMEEAKNGDVYSHFYGEILRHENIDEFHIVPANEYVIKFFQKNKLNN